MGIDAISLALLVVMCINAALAGVLMVNKTSGGMGRLYAINVITIIVWSGAIYFYRIASPDTLLLWTKHLYVSATLVASTFLYFTYLFSKTPRYLWDIASIISIINLIMIGVIYATDIIILDAHVRQGMENTITFGKGFFVYASYILSFFLFGFYNIYRQIKHVGEQQREQLRYLLFGYSASANIAFVTNLLLPWFGIFYLNWLGQVATALMVVALAYAIFKHKMFNVQVIAAETFTFVLWAILFLRIPLASNKRDVYIDTIILIGAVILGFLLIKSVFKEVDSRQKNERLAKYLANANARLRELDRQKTEFVSIASHQLRAPVAAIRGYTSLVMEGSYGEVPPKLKDPLDRVVESGRRLALMIDDFLNVSRIEQGRMNYHMERLNLALLVNTVYEEQRLSAQKKGLQCTFKPYQGEPLWIIGDEGKLKQIFSNLIDNAIKYTQHGSVDIAIFHPDNHSAAMVEIKDTGIGISQADQEQLFHKFKRAQNANEANVYGTGLGLYIAKEIIRAHNGWIHVSSPGVGKGSKFSVELPCQK